MKTCSALMCLLVLTCMAAYGQTASTPAASVPQPGAASAPSGQSSIDPAKEADIRKLMEISGAATIAQQTMASMLESIKPLLSNSLPPGEYREKLVDLFFAKFQSKANVKGLLDLEVPIYAKYYSDEEIKGLIQFYQTPLGQKTLSVLPKLAADTAELGKQWGGALGEQCMHEVLAEHPDLESAMVAAGKDQQ